MGIGAGHRDAPFFLGNSRTAIGSPFCGVPGDQAEDGVAFGQRFLKNGTCFSMKSPACSRTSRFAGRSNFWSFSEPIRRIPTKGLPHLEF